MRIHTLAIAAILFFATAASCSAASGRHVVIVVAGNMSIRDIADSGHRRLEELVRNSAAALMNTRTGRQCKYTEPAAKAGMEPGCVSIGAGAQAVGGGEVDRASNVKGAVSGLPAAKLYQIRTGSPPGTAEVIHTEIAKIQRANSLASYRATPGLLGSTLHKEGIKTALIGNSDIPDGIHREAAAVAMDRDGRIDYGNVDPLATTRVDGSAPYGLRADIPAILREFDRVYPKSGFVVINYGDTLRADAYAAFCEDEQAARIRRQAGDALEDLLMQIQSRLDLKNDLLILVSPNSPTASDMAEDRMAPILIKGPGFDHGMLTSPSTRRDGVVTICDIAPTVLSFFGIKPPVEMVGRPMRSIDHPDTAGALLDLNQRASRQAQRQSAMRGGSIVQSVMVVLVTLVVVLGVAGLWRRLAEWAALVPVALPIVMLYLPLIYSGGLVGAAVLLIFLTIAVLALCALIFKSALRAFIWLCGIIIASLTIDLLRGAPLITASIAGYNITEGARYYGIGNELMGTMLGAGLMGVGAAFAAGKLSARSRGMIAALIFAVILISIGAPMLGTNAGGAAAAAPAIAVALLARRKGKLAARDIVWVLLFAVLAIGAMFGADAMRGSAAQSHVGRAAGAAASGGVWGLLMMAQRKLALNFILLGASPWSRLLGLALLGSAVIFFWAKKVFGKSPLSGEENAAATACMVGVVCAFAFNDSGVVAAATCSVFLWSLLALRMLQLSTAKKRPED